MHFFFLFKDSLCIFSFLPYDTLGSLFKNLLRAISLFFTFPRFLLDSAVGGLSVGCQSHLKIIIISNQLTGPEPENHPTGYAEEHQIQITLHDFRISFQCHSLPLDLEPVLLFNVDF